MNRQKSLATIALAMIYKIRLWGRQRGLSLDETDKLSSRVGNYGMKVLYTAVESTVE